MAVSYIAHMTNAQQLAIALHEALCAREHTEACTWLWEYEPASMWQRGAHIRWLNKAHALLAELDGDLALALRICKLGLGA